MTKLLMTLAVLVSTNAQAGYWRCDGKQMTVSFTGLGQGALRARNTASEVPSAASTANVVKANLKFDGKGRGLKNVVEVSGYDYWNNLLKLIISEGSVQLIDTHGTVVRSDSEMNCQYSEGE